MFVFRRSIIDGSIKEKYWATYSVKDGIITYKYNYGNEYKLNAYKWNDDNNVLLLGEVGTEDDRLEYFYGALDLFARKYVFDLK